MINIRRGIFETNSSSMDKYDDYDDVTPYYSKGSQYVNVRIKWKEYVSSERKEEILDDIDGHVIDEEVENILLAYYEKSDPAFQEIFNVDEFGFKVNMDISVDIDDWEPGYKGDRYCPPSEPTPYFDYSNIMPSKEFPEEKELKEQFMEVFRAHGWTEIESIISIRGEEMDEEELIDRIPWK